MTLGQGSVVLLFVTYILAARTLGDTGFGEFALGLTIATVLFLLPAWGSSRYSAIMAARDPGQTRKILATHLGLTATLTIPYLPVAGVAAFVLTDNPTVVWVTLFLAVDQLARELGNFFRLLFRVHDGYPLEALTSFAERGGVFIAAIMVLFLSPNPVHLAAAFAAGRSMGTLVTAVVYRFRVGPIGFRLHLASLRELFLAGTPLALRRGISVLTFRVDMLFLGGMRPANEVGWYGSVYTLMDGVLMVPTTVNGSIGPTISANFGEARRHVVCRLYERGLKYLLIIGVFMGAVCAMLADPIVDILYGSEYAPAAAALRILAISITFVFIRSLNTEVLDDVDLRTAALRVFGAGLVLNVVLNALLIPRYGYLGAAASTALTEALLMGGTLWALHTAGYPGHFFRQARAPILSILLPLGVLWQLAGTPVVAGLTAGVTYLLGLTLFGAWDDKDRDLFRGLWSRGRARFH